MKQAELQSLLITHVRMKKVRGNLHHVQKSTRVFQQQPPPQRHYFRIVLVSFTGYIFFVDWPD